MVQWQRRAAGRRAIRISLVLGLIAASAGCATKPSSGEDAAKLLADGPAKSPTTTAAPAPTTTTTRPAPTTTTTVPATTVVTTPPAPPPVEPAPDVVVHDASGAPLPPTFTPVLVATAAVPTVYAYEAPPGTADPALSRWSFDGLTQFGSPTTFLVEEQRGDWLRVVLPIRRNGTSGWISTADVALTQTETRIVVDVAAARVALWEGSKVIVDTEAVVGKSSTPTPGGTYFITDVIDTQDPYGPYGPYVLATSARSEVFDFFNGGEPLVGLHGTNAPWLLGTAASNGCVRLPNEIATALSQRVPLGAAVHIYA